MKWTDLLKAVVTEGATSNAAFGATTAADDAKKGLFNFAGEDAGKPLYLDAEGNDVTKDALKHGTTDKYIAPSFAQRLFAPESAGKIDDANFQYKDAAPAAARDFSIQKQQARDIIRKGLEAHTGHAASDDDVDGFLGQTGLSVKQGGLSGGQINAAAQASEEYKRGIPALTAQNRLLDMQSDNMLRQNLAAGNYPSAQAQAMINSAKYGSASNAGNLGNLPYRLESDRTGDLLATSRNNAAMGGVQTKADADLEEARLAYERAKAGHKLVGPQADTALLDTQLRGEQAKNRISLLPITNNLDRYQQQNALDREIVSNQYGVPALQAQAEGSEANYRNLLNSGRARNVDTELDASRNRNIYDSANFAARTPFVNQAAATENDQNRLSQLQSNLRYTNAPAYEAASMAGAKFAGDTATARMQNIPFEADRDRAVAIEQRARALNPGMGTQATVAPRFFDSGPNAGNMVMAPNIWQSNPFMDKMNSEKAGMATMQGAGTNSFLANPTGTAVMGLPKQAVSPVIPVVPSLAGASFGPTNAPPPGIAALQGTNTTPALYQNQVQQNIGSQQPQQQQGGRVSIMGQNLGEVQESVQDNLYKDLSNREKNHYLHLTDAEKQWLQKYRTQKHLTDILPDTSGGSTLQTD